MCGQTFVNNMIIETQRLILREMQANDDKAMFELDSDPEVHKFLGNNPYTTIEQSREIIASVQRQYVTNGIGRWVVIEKSTNSFVGWSGLKFLTEPVNNRYNIYDVGYRLLKKYWGKGYATESALAAIDYGFNNLKLEEIFAAANINNTQSINALHKCGLKFIEHFDHNGIACNWYKITKNDWEYRK
jgi:RimJ/RimL family protein N-acetyltransferase